MGMSYEELGNIVAEYGRTNGDEHWQDLQYVMKHSVEMGIESLGNGQIRITDFSRFAEHMNWEVGGEAYI